MRILELIVATPLAQALGWTLLHSLWEGVAIAAALGAVMMSTRSPRVRYASACLAMLTLVVSAAFTLARVMPAAAPANSAIDVLAATAQLSGVPGEFQRPRLSLATAVPWLAPFWIAGVWILALRQIAGWIAVSRLRRRGVCAVEDRWRRQLARLQSRLGLSRPVLLLESCLAEVPVVVGHLRPVILMPIGVLAGLPAGQVESILLHELAHIRRCDYLVNLLQRAVECLFFYHPAVWWMSRVIRSERENCCDDIVATTCDDVHEYAVALATLEQKRLLGPQPALAATGGSLMKRIRRLLQPTASGVAWSPVLIAFILVGTAAAAFAAWPAREAPKSDAPQQAAAAQSSVYDKWLNEDVVYIITGQERTRFLSLTSDAERDDFVRQFWERRNPGPAGSGNAFKAEHYRRLAYSNQHFAGSTPGWRSDRGQIYIRFGPPDSIASHPDAAPPSETWTYRSAGGEARSFTFVDRTGNGDYQLVSGGSPSLQPARLGASDGFVRRPVAATAAATQSNGGPPTGSNATRLQEIRFLGVTQLDSTALNDCASRLKAPIYGGPDLQSQVAERARVLCWQHAGYFKAQVSPEIRRLPDQDGVQQYALTLTVNEGEQYRLRSVQFRNNRAFSTSELRAMFPIADGSVFDSLAVRDGIGAMRQAYGSRGYTDWSAASNVQVDDANHAVDVVMNIQEDRTDSTVRISENVASGNLVHRVEPAYPDIAQAAHVQGDAVYQVIIGTDGNVKNIRVLSGHPMLVQAGMDAIRQWRYKSFYVNNQPVEVTTQVTIPFRLPGSEATASQQPPDMSCTFYDKGQPYDGVCEASEQNTNLYFCRVTDGSLPRQPQMGCEWKVKRLRDWQQSQGQGK